MNLDDAINEFYIETEELGFNFLCKSHNHLNNKDEYMKMHLFKEHDISLPFENWQIWFTLFSVGDSYSSNYRCNVCDSEFLFESEAKNHILTHGVKLSEFENLPKKVSMIFFNGLENEKLIQVFDPQKICEHCNQKGAYVIENDPIVGVCFQELKKIYSDIEEIKEI